ncbi:MAG: hypothetical protein JSS40_14380 [Proteobacteria bacterium]|nr:hypothetical protein [Pseudomonadota bacterium]
MKLALDSQSAANVAAAALAAGKAEQLRAETGEIIDLETHRAAARRWRAAAAVSIFALTGAVTSAGIWAPTVSASAMAYARRHPIPSSYLLGVAADPVPATAGEAGAPLKLAYELSAAPVSER